METKPLPGLALYPYVEGGAFIETQFVKNALKPKDSWQYLKSPCRLLSQATPQPNQPLLLATSTVPKCEHGEARDSRVRA